MAMTELEIYIEAKKAFDTVANVSAKIAQISWGEPAPQMDVYLPLDQVTDDVLLQQIESRKAMKALLHGATMLTSLSDEISVLGARVAYLMRAGSLTEPVQLIAQEDIEAQIDYRCILSQDLSQGDDVCKGLLKEAGILLDRLYATDYVKMVQTMLEESLAKVNSPVPVPPTEFILK